MLLSLAGVAPAGAQLFYTDSYGRAAEFIAPDIKAVQLSAEGDTAEEIAGFFRRACLDSKLVVEVVDAVASASKWQMVRRDVKIPFTRPEFETPVARWLGSGRALVVASVTIGIPTGSGFRVEGPQCTLVTGSPTFDRPALEAALTAVLGAGPSNVAEAFKNGKPNKRYEPRWMWAGQNGLPQEVGFAMIRPYGATAGKLQVALIPPRPAKKK